MRTVFVFFTLAVVQSLSAQETFSIVAVDTVTGEVGSAGASCIANSIIISDVKPGRGAIHTQSYWNANNQTLASMMMDDMVPPQDIIDSLIVSDANANPTIRQYGLVYLPSFGGQRTAAYTGSNCFDYKNHNLGPTYSIQGNILLGQQILDSMEARFLAAEGDLACKLMAALQGANVPGADTRCLPDSTSSISAFIRVARPSDTSGTFVLDINVGSTPTGVEPIDSLQVLFSQAHACFGTGIKANRTNEIKVSVSNYGDELVFSFNIPITGLLCLYDVNGKQINRYLLASEKSKTFTQGKQPNGIYFYRIDLMNGQIMSGTFTHLN